MDGEGRLPVVIGSRGNEARDASVCTSLLLLQPSTKVGSLVRERRGEQEVDDRTHLSIHSFIFLRDCSVATLTVGVILT